MQSDAELVAGVIRGEDEAFALLYRRCRTRPQQYARSLVRPQMEAEDVVHDVFVAPAKEVGGGRSPVSGRGA